MRKLLHVIAHWFKWNYGKVITYYSDDGTLMVGFKCTTCGKITGVSICYTQTTGTDPLRHKEEV